MTDWDVVVASIAGELSRDLRADVAEVALARERPFYDAWADRAASEAMHSAADLDWVAAELNDRPRKRLAFRKPIEEINPLLLR